MAQELIQENKKKELSFEEICPTHSSILAKWDTLTDREKMEEIGVLKCCADSCFIGEAHGGNLISMSTCSACCRFASSNIGLPMPFDYAVELDQYSRPVKCDIRVDWKIFESMKADFVKHWNKVHVKQ